MAASGHLVVTMHKKLPKFKKFEFVEIYFWDSISSTKGWERLEDFDFENHLSATEHKISGYVIKCTKTLMSLCQVVAIDNEEKMTGVWSLPIGAIIKLRRIK